MVSSTAITAALLSTGFISLLPNVILLLFPSYGAGTGGEASTILQLGQSLAAGGLLGDVFLHTLPHSAMDEHKAGLWVLAGFTIFLASDLLIRTIESNTNGGHHYHHHHVSANGRSHREVSDKVIKPSAIFLNLAADSLHNFTDGLAIGASYAAQEHPTELSIATLLASRGGLATLSILFHELPHELGDFCTLVRAGYSKRQAVAAQFVTAVAAFMGTIVALHLSEGSTGEHLLLITAGGFVYLAAVTILPDVLEEGSAKVKFLQLISFCAGIGFLYMVALLEEAEHDHGHSDHHHHHSHDRHNYHDASNHDHHHESHHHHSEL